MRVSFEGEVSSDDDLVHEVPFTAHLPGVVYPVPVHLDVDAAIFAAKIWVDMCRSVRTNGGADFCGFLEGYTVKP